MKGSYSVPASITTAIRKEVEKRTTSLQEIIDKQTVELESLRTQVELHNSTIKSSEVPVAIQVIDGNLNRMYNLLNSCFHISFDIGTSIQRIPLDFAYHVSFYNNRATIYALFDELKIKYNEWHKGVILPHEWDAECLDLFLTNISNHHNEVSRDSIAEWYNNYREKLLNPIAQVSGNWGRIPLDILFMNPHWADDPIAEKIKVQMAEDKYHSKVIMGVFKYNSNFTDDQILDFLEVAPKEYFVYMVGESSRIKKLAINSPIQKIRNKVLDNISIEESFPANLQEDFIDSMDFMKAVKYIYGNTTFSETEKQQLLQKQLNKHYSKDAILERVFETKK